jgi:hypothetical protein
VGGYRADSVPATFEGFDPKTPKPKDEKMCCTLFWYGQPLRSKAVISQKSDLGCRGYELRRDEALANLALRAIVAVSHSRTPAHECRSRVSLLQLNDSFVRSKDA